MNRDTHPVDELLRSVVGIATPSRSITDQGRSRLEAAIADEANTRVQRQTGHSGEAVRVGWLRPALALAGVAIFAVAAMMIGSVLTPAPVTALGDLAAVVEEVAPVVADGEVLYTESRETSISTLEGSEIGLPDREFVAYLLPLVTERWTSDSTVTERTTVGRPQFFSPEVEAAYRSSGQAAVDGVGEVRVVTYPLSQSDFGIRDWPTDDDGLLAAMRSYVSNEGGDASEAASVLALAGTLSRDPGATPELRAALLRVLADLDVEVMRFEDGGAIVAAEFVENGVPSRVELEFDADGYLECQRLIWLRGEPDVGVRGVTVVSDLRTTPAIVVDAGERP